MPVTALEDREQPPGFDGSLAIIIIIIIIMSKPTQPARRLLIFQETRNPQNTAETVYVPVNKLGLPICGEGPDLPSILELPLRVMKVFTDIFNQPKYKGWYV